MSRIGILMYASLVGLLPFVSQYTTPKVGFDLPVKASEQRLVKPRGRSEVSPEEWRRFFSPSIADYIASERLSSLAFPTGEIREERDETESKTTK